MDERKSAGKQLLLLLIGLLMCGSGIYLFLNHISVEAFTFGSMYGRWGLFGGRGIPGGMIVLPLILGIILWVIFPENFIGKFVSMLGMLFIIFGVVSSVNLRWRTSSAYEFIFMLFLIFGGGALALRILFMPDLNGKKKGKDKMDEINKLL